MKKIQAKESSPLLTSLRKKLYFVLGPLFFTLLLLIGLLLCLKLSSPYFYATRNTLYLVLASLGLWGLYRYRRFVATSSSSQVGQFKSKLKRFNFTLALLLVSLTFLNALHMELLKQWIWQQKGSAFTELGQHFIVGFRDFAEVKQLAKQGAIGGVYWARAHFRDKSLAQIKSEIQILQKIRQEAGLAPLVMALDEEGGIVSALEERLGPQPSLAHYSEVHGEEEKIHGQIRSFSADKAKRLKELGFNVNFAPVVDLKFFLKENFMDAHSLIRHRSAGSDPDRVTQRALEYSQTLLQYGITPTLKHFPGLGRVSADTHFHSGALSEDLSKLQQSDLKPFREILQQLPAWTMLSHTKLLVLDAKEPVSVSKQVVQDLLRKDWQHEGILITDDMSMGPIAARPGGVGQAAVDGLNIGVDYLLISKDPQLFYLAMAALLRAKAQGDLIQSTLVKSSQRMDLWQQGQNSSYGIYENSYWKKFIMAHRPMSISTLRHEVLRSVAESRKNR